MYARSLGLGGSYGHKFKDIKIEELIHYDGVVVRDGVRSDSGGVIHCRWQEGRGYNDLIYCAQPY